MRKFRFFSFIVALFAFGFAVGETKAQEDVQPEDPRPPMERRQQRRPNLLQELNLSPEQIQQIRRINQARRPLMQEAQHRFREANRALDAAIYAASPNEAEVQARMKEVQQAQAEIIKIRTSSEIAIRKILTPEQLVKFRELRERFMRRLQNRQNPPPQTEDFSEQPQQPRDVNNPNRQNLNPRRRGRRGF